MSIPKVADEHLFLPTPTLEGLPKEVRGVIALRTPYSDLKSWASTSGDVSALFRSEHFLRQSSTAKRDVYNTHGYLTDIEVEGIKQLPGIVSRIDLLTVLGASAQGINPNGSEIKPGQNKHAKELVSDATNFNIDGKDISAATIKANIRARIAEKLQAKLTPPASITNNLVARIVHWLKCKSGFYHVQLYREEIAEKERRFTFIRGIQAELQTKLQNPRSVQNTRDLFFRFISLKYELAGSQVRDTTIFEALREQREDSGVIARIYFWGLKFFKVFSFQGQQKDYSIDYFRGAHVELGETILNEGRVPIIATIYREYDEGDRINSEEGLLCKDFLRHNLDISLGLPRGPYNPVPTIQIYKTWKSQNRMCPMYEAGSFLDLINLRQHSIRFEFKGREENTLERQKLIQIAVEVFKRNSAEKLDFEASHDEHWMGYAGGLRYSDKTKWLEEFFEEHKKDKKEIVFPTDDLGSRRMMLYKSEKLDADHKTQFYSDRNLTYPAHVMFGHHGLWKDMDITWEEMLETPLLKIKGSVLPICMNNINLYERETPPVEERVGAGAAQPIGAGVGSGEIDADSDSDSETSELEEEQERKRT